MNSAIGVAVDASGNVYVADTGDNAIKEWNAASETVSTLVSGLKAPQGVAVDSSDNVYFSDTGNNAIKEWKASTHAVSTLVTGLHTPEGVALDSSNNVYIADTVEGSGGLAGSILKWNHTTHAVSTLWNGLFAPEGVAVDASGNVYFSDTVGDVIDEWNAASGAVTSLVSTGLDSPVGVAVDGSGNVYFADSLNGNVDEWVAATKTVTTLVSSAWPNEPQGVAVDSAKNVYITYPAPGTVSKYTQAFLSATALSEGDAAGSDTLTVLPSSTPLTGIFAPSSNQSWLTINSVSGGTVSFSVTADTGAARTADISILGQQVAVSQPSLAVLSTTSLLEGPAAGGDSDYLTVIGPWTATANDAWLHVTNASGSGNSLVSFTFDANTGGTRTGTLSIAGDTLTVTQLATGYVPANPVIVPFSQTGEPVSVAATGSGDLYTLYIVYIDSVKEWNATTQTLTTLISGLKDPTSVAVDGSGNVYVVDYGDSAIKEWNAATQTVTTLVSTGLNYPWGLAVDSSGNVYISDGTNGGAIKEWSPGTDSLTTLVSSGLLNPEGLAVDASGNVYVADAQDSAIKEWKAASQSLTTLVSSGLSWPADVALDGSGNVYIADMKNDAIMEWNATTGAFTTVASEGLTAPWSVAVSGNIFVADQGDDLVKELPPRAFVFANPVSEGSAAGSDALPAVVPSIRPLTAAFAPSSDQGWLTITNVSNGVVSFSFTQNTGPASRVAHISLLGQQITVTQVPTLATAAFVEGPAAGSGSDAVSFAGAWTATSNASWLHTTSSGTGSGTATFTFDANPGGTRTGTLTIAGETLTVTQVPSQPLATTSLLEGPAAGSDSDIVCFAGAWTASANASWLHTTSTGSGIGSATFTFDANPGGTRTGTLTIAGETLTVTQAGSGYVAAGTVGLVSSGLSDPTGVAVDATGNVYFADSGNNAVKEWNAATQTVSTLISSGLKSPRGVAVDSSGNVNIVDTGDNAVKEWNAATQTVATLISSGLNSPEGLAVDGSGNVYIADTGDNAIKEWNVATGTPITIVSGLNSPEGVAVNAAGNVYIADTGDNAIKEWNPSAQPVSTLVSSGLNNPAGVAVDGSGNVYIADTGNNAVKEWVAATQVVNTLLSSGLKGPGGVAVDAEGNVAVGDSSNNAVKELPRAFVSGAIGEGAAAGGDTLLPVLPSTVPLTGAFAPASDQGWLTIGTVSGDAVSFSFAANKGTAGRTAHITEFGQSVTVTQAPVLATAALVEGPAAGSDSVAVSFAGTWTASTNAGWLHTSSSGTGNGTATFTFDANTTASPRTGTLTIAGETLTVTQKAGLGATLLVEGPAAGSDSVIVTYPGAWQITSPPGWIHPAISSGNGNGLATFTFDANTGPTRTGTLTIAGDTLTVIQAGSGYVAAAAGGLVSSGLNAPRGIGLDASGNLYLANQNGNSVVEWNAATRTLATLVSSGLNSPQSVAVDDSGNVYIADYGNNAIEQWVAATQAVTTLLSSSSGLNSPTGVAVDAAGNVYFTNVSGYVYVGDNIVALYDLLEWNAATQTVSTLVSSGLNSGLNSPQGVAVDAAGNVYIADSGNNAVEEWNATTKTLSTLATGLNSPRAWRWTARATFISPTRATTPSRSGTPPRSRSAPWSPRG